MDGEREAALRWIIKTQIDQLNSLQAYRDELEAELTQQRGRVRSLQAELRAARQYREES